MPGLSKSPSNQERQIVVHRDNRTLEQQHSDRLSSIERTQNHYSSTDIVPRTGNELFPRGWFQELDRWMAETHRNWHDDIRRMRENLFSLLPVDEFGLQSMLEPRGSFFSVPSIIQRMERQMDAMRRNMQEMMKRDFDFWTPFPRLNDGALDFLKDAYQVGEDGKLHFIVRFDLQGFCPENINVTTTKNCLTVKAQKATKTANSSDFRQYYRMIYLPDSVEDAKIKCHLNRDGILTLDAPVNEADYNRLTFDRNKRIAIKPSAGSTHRQSSVTFTEKPTTVTFLGRRGLSVLDNNDGGKKIHVEVPLEPGFGSDDIRVSVEANELVVRGRKPVFEEKGNQDDKYWKEFTRTFKLPQTIDTLSIRTRIERNTMLIEAPLLESK